MRQLLKVVRYAETKQREVESTLSELSRYTEKRAGQIVEKTLPGATSTEILMAGLSGFFSFLTLHYYIIRCFSCTFDNTIVAAQGTALFYLLFRSLRTINKERPANERY